MEGNATSLRSAAWTTIVAKLREQEKLEGQDEGTQTRVISIEDPKRCNSLCRRSPNVQRPGLLPNAF